MAGHSRWAQVKHKKAITDAKRSQLFSKTVREISVAVKEGGAAEDANPRLRTALVKARSIGLPKENVQRAITGASVRGTGENLQEFLYEATAPGGVMILVEGITDNKNRTLAQVKKMASEHNAKLVPQNSLIWNFKKVRIEDGTDYLPGVTAHITGEEENKLSLLLDGLLDLDDVQEVYTNLAKEEDHESR